MRTKVDPPIQVIDLARAFCIYLVVQKHLILSTLVLKPVAPWAAWFFLKLCENGIYGVFLFFVLSGFLITRLADRMPGGLFGFNLRAFYVRRVARIAPLFVLAVGLGFLFWAFTQPGRPASIFCFNMPAATQAGFWLSLMTFSFNWYCVAHPAFYFSQGFHWILLWSLSVEEQFYLLYPLFLLRVKRLQTLEWTLGILVGLGPLVRWICVRAWPGEALLTSISTIGIFDCIAAGALLYLASKRTKRFLDSNRAASAALCAGGAFVLLTALLGTAADDPGNQIFTPTLLALGLGAFLLGAFSLRGFENKFLGVLGLPGKWSYGIYLLHIVVLFGLWPLLKGRDLLQCGFLYAPALMGTAVISFYFFEVPVNLWIRRQGVLPPTRKRKHRYSR
jgi:peptidoglycan/LPS O-acetylase OafA/YrhL